MKSLLQVYGQTGKIGLNVHNRVVLEFKPEEELVTEMISVKENPLKNKNAQQKHVQVVKRF